MKKRRTICLFLILVVLASCSKTMDVSQQRSRMARKENMPIKIGLVWPFQLYQDLIEEGVRLGIDQINESGGILGKQIELLVKDDQSDINEGLRIAERWAEDPEVMAVIGHCDSYVSLAVALVYEINGLIMFSPGSTSTELTEKGYRYVFRNVPTDSLVGEKTAQWCKDNDHTSIIISYAGTSYGLGLANSFERKARELGLRIHDRSVFNLGDAAEFDYILNRWKVYDYDAVFFAGLPDAGMSFITQLRRLESATGDISHPVIGGDGLDTVALLTLPEEVSRDVFAVTMYNPYSSRVEAIRFNSAYLKRYNHDPDSWAALGYDALNIIAEAMRHAGSCDPRKAAPEIHKLKKWVGVTGTHTFNENGDVSEKTLALKFIFDGEFKYIDLE
jgi:branched-chain amino acid transport system substrate-binding protein